MRIIVVGAGEVGSYVAEKLSRESHDVALIEQDAARAAELAGQLDALVVLGSGTDPQTLADVGASRADLVVAVTSDDETNVVSAMLAKHAGATRSIVRVQSRALRDAIAGALAQRTGADMVIDPDEETSAEVLELVQYPGAIEVEVMAGGAILVLGFRLGADAPIVGHTLQEMAVAYAPNWQFLFGAITREGETVIPRGDQRLEAGDHVRVVCTPEGRHQVAGLIGLQGSAPQRVLLLGGGRTAELLAPRLARQISHVALVERNADRATQLAERLEGVTVLGGDITNADLLTEIEVGTYDLVVALTGDDDANILACLYAKSAGVTETVAVVHRLSLLPLLTDVGIDGALSPRTATANAVLRFARGGVTAVATFLHGDVEVLELEIQPGSPAAGKTLAELHLPKEALVGAVLTKSGAQIGRGSTRLEPTDRIVLFAKPSALSAAKATFG